MSQRGEALAAFGLDDHEVLDPHAEPSWDVHPGLHGHRVAGRERLVDLRSEPRELVDLEPDAVTGPVTELLPATATFDLVSRRRVDGIALHVRSYRRSGGSLRTTPELVDLPLL